MPAFNLLVCLGVVPVLSLSSHPSDSSTHQSEDHTTKARAASHSVPGGKTLWGYIHFLELPEQFTTNWWLKPTETCSLTVREAKCPKLRCREVHAPSEGSRKEPFLAPLLTCNSVWQRVASLHLWQHHSNFCFCLHMTVFSVCVSLCLFFVFP